MTFTGQLFLIKGDLLFKTRTGIIGTLINLRLILKEAK